jgi:antitoxin component YwqK of YwqJK toxin-antitoxin module
MKLLYSVIITLILGQLQVFAQNPVLNKTDSKGLKQGPWVKKYPNGHIQYKGDFKDDHPIGLFMRYYDTDTLQSALEFSPDGKEAEALLFHPNGYLASSGKYIDQKKEGKWKIYSSRIKGFVVIEEEYKNNLLNGISIKYYQNNTIAEKLSFVNNIKSGEWLQYFPSGNICLKGTYINGKLDGPFFTYYNDGKPEYTGSYKKDMRDGTWKIYNPDGSVRNTMIYVDGEISNPDAYKKETEYLDLLEKNKGKIADPEKTGTLW